MGVSCPGAIHYMYLWWAFPGSKKGRVVGLNCTWESIIRSPAFHIFGPDRQEEKNANDKGH